jgi:hypothetical protein
MKTAEHYATPEKESGYEMMDLLEIQWASVSACRNRANTTPKN